MYKIVKTDDVGVWGDRKPVLTMKDEYGGRAQVVVDDHCYVLLLLDKDGKYKPTNWIFPEAHEAMKTLPSPA